MIHRSVAALLFCCCAAVATDCAKTAAPSADAGSGGTPGLGGSGGHATSGGSTGTGAIADSGVGGAVGGADSRDAATVGDGSAGAAGGGGRDYSTDRKLFFGPSRCAAAKVQLCEDFESGVLDARTWQTSGDKPAIDGGQAARGTKALHITKVGDGPSYIQETKTFPATDSVYYGRMFAYFKSLPQMPPDNYAHWTIAAASGTGVMGETRLSGQFQNGANHFGVGTDSYGDANGTGDWTTSDNDPPGKAVAVPSGKLAQWVCLEWMHNGATNETRFWWDGVEHPSLHTTESMNGGNKKPFILPTYNKLWIGWYEYKQKQAATETFELWIDEIAIDPVRIGCVL